MGNPDPPLVSNLLRWEVGNYSDGLPFQEGFFVWRKVNKVYAALLQRTMSSLTTSIKWVKLIGFTT